MSKLHKSKLSKKIKSLKKKLRSVSVKATLAISGGRYYRSRKNRSHRRRHRQRGGYGQYQNNEAISLSYSLGGNLSPSESMLANPPPFQVTNTAVDNYNHFTGKGFSSAGH